MFGKSHSKMQLLKSDTKNCVISIKWSYSIKIILSLNIS